MKDTTINQIKETVRAARPRDSLARIADALETLAAPVNEMMEPAPPQCPHCQDLNPVIQTEDSEGAGPINSYVIRGHCRKCGRIVYCVSEQWVIHATVSEAEIHVNGLTERMNELVRN